MSETLDTNVFRRPRDKLPAANAPRWKQGDRCMHTLRLFASGQLQVPASTAWYLSDLGEFRGKQELYTRQSPQRLKVLREHALIESVVSSKHDPWPFINYVLSIFKFAYREFEERVGQISAPRGSKRELVLASIARLAAMHGKRFAISALEQSCPGVSRDMVRRVLREQQAAGALIC